MFLILGSGGHAKSLAAVLSRLGTDYEVRDIESAIPDLTREPGRQAIFGLIGSDLPVRRAIIQSLPATVRIFGITALSSLIDPTAFLDPTVQVLEKTFIGPNVSVGAHSVINTGAIVEHDVTVGSNSFIGPGALILGRVIIGDDVFVGAGAKLLPRVSVVSGSTIGAGAVVTKSIQEPGVYVGVPAKPL